MTKNVSEQLIDLSTDIVMNANGVEPLFFDETVVAWTQPGETTLELVATLDAPLYYKSGIRVLDAHMRSEEDGVAFHLYVDRRTIHKTTLNNDFLAEIVLGAFRKNFTKDPNHTYIGYTGHAKSPFHIQVNPRTGIKQLIPGTKPPTVSI